MYTISIEYFFYLSQIPEDSVTTLQQPVSILGKELIPGFIEIIKDIVSKLKTGE